MKTIRNLNWMALGGLFFILFGWAIIAGIVWLSCFIF